MCVFACAYIEYVRLGSVLFSFYLSVHMHHFRFSFFLFQFILCVRRVRRSAFLLIDFSFTWNRFPFRLSRLFAEKKATIVITSTS